MFKHYKRPTTLDAANLELQNNNAVIIGGMQWLKMSNSNKDTVIDLIDLGLDEICEDKQNFTIGAMTTLRELETNKKLNKHYQNIFKEALGGIVGVQFRNLATIGGSVYGRYNFSDVITILMALNSQVKLFNAGILSLKDFLHYPRSKKDILTHIIIPKFEYRSFAFECIRFTKTDFSILNLAISKNENDLLLSVGARPAISKLINIEYKNKNNEEISELATKQLDFGNDIRASESYRKKICPILIDRALRKMENNYEN